MEKWMKLEEIFDLREWEKFQDVIAHESKMAIIIVNYKGEPVTKHSECHSFCDAARKDERLRKYCQRCDARAGFEAMQNQELFIYKCYFSVVDIAIPIVVKNRYIGAIMAGQIRLHQEEEGQLETILSPSDKEYVEEKRKEWDAEYRELPYLSLGRIRIIAKLLYYLCNYMCTESSNKLHALEMYEAVFNSQLSATEASAQGMNVQGMNASNMPSPKEGYHEAIEQSRQMEEVVDPNGLATDDWVLSKEESLDDVKNEIRSYIGEDYGTYHRVVRDIFEYIFEHKEERPSLSDMAEHCNVSTGYLSHLFTKETGESYSAFMTRLKMDWAKGILETTDETITEISEKLGFQDTAYFIKVFKRQVGVTPLVYKKYCKIK